MYKMIGFNTAWIILIKSYATTQGNIILMNWCNTVQDEIYWWKDMLQQNVSHFKFELISANTIIPTSHHVRMANIG